MAERLGDQRTAEARYRFVAELWRNADPALQGYVTEAKAGLVRVRRRAG